MRLVRIGAARKSKIADLEVAIAIQQQITWFLSVTKEKKDESVTIEHATSAIISQKKHQIRNQVCQSTHQIAVKDVRRVNVFEAAQNLIHKVLCVFVRQRLRRGDDSESQKMEWIVKRKKLKVQFKRRGIFTSPEKTRNVLVEVSVEKFRHEINVFKSLLGLWPQNVPKRNDILVVEVAQKFDLAQRAFAFDDIGECWRRGMVEASHEGSGDKMRRTAGTVKNNTTPLEGANI